MGLNLLPYDKKRQLKAAHANVFILRYLLFILIGIAFLAVISVASYFLLTNLKASNEQAQKTSSVTPITNNSTNQLDQIKSNVNSAYSILQGQTSFKEILSAINNALPTGTIIENITLSRNNINNPITLSIYSKDSSSENTIKQSFDSNPIFSAVSITKDSSKKSTIAGYSTIYSLTVSISQDNN